MRRRREQGRTANQIAKFKDKRLADFVTNGCAAPARGNNADLAQNAEMLGCVGLLEAANAVNFPNAARPLAQTVQNTQPGRITKNGKQRGQAF